jgi:hypothetical protein
LVRIWKEAGAELEAIKRRELEAMTDADVRAQVKALFSGFDPAEWEISPKRESGLVQQQRWFARARRRR